MVFGEERGRGKVWGLEREQSLLGPLRGRPGGPVWDLRITTKAVMDLMGKGVSDTCQALN